MSPVELFKALADETRLKALLLLQQEGELCVCELMIALAQNQPKVSRHLALLRKAELVLDRRESQWVYYRLNPDVAPWVGEVLRHTADGTGHYIEAERRRLSAMSERPAAGCC